MKIRYYKKSLIIIKHSKEDINQVRISILYYFNFRYITIEDIETISETNTMTNIIYGCKRAVDKFNKLYR